MGVRQDDIPTVEKLIRLIGIKTGIQREPEGAIGYCQGLFHKDGATPSAHTVNVKRYLEEVEAPYPTSHELLRPYQPVGMSTTEYVKQAGAPLSLTGRVPILITTLDPSTDASVIDEVFSDHECTGTMLVRLALNSPDSIRSAAALLERVVSTAEVSGFIPSRYPLFQSDSYSSKDWNDFKHEAGDHWDYAAVAVSPFTSKAAIEAIKPNVAVAQYFVGDRNRINSDGTITLPAAMCVQDGKKGESVQYNVFEYKERIRDIRALNIVCGQALPSWSHSENLDRVGMYMHSFGKVILG